MDKTTSLPTEADYRAADEVIALFGKIHAPGEGARERLAARCHSQGESTFRLTWGLRQPANFREELILKRMAGLITAEQFAIIIRESSDKYLTDQVLNERYQELQEEVLAYGEFIRNCFSVVHERHKPFVEIDCDENIDALCSKLDEKSSFSKEELEYLQGFIAEARIHYQAGIVQLPNFTAGSYTAIVVLANGTWRKVWKERNQDGHVPSLLDFCKPCLDVLPRPQDLSAMLEHEFALARMYLRHLQSTNSAPRAVDAEQMTLTVNAAEVILNMNSADSDDDSERKRTSNKLKVSHWSELAIGIDAKGYWGLVPAPDFGGRFPTSKSVRLPLGGPRWRALLERLASSPDGTVSRIDLILEFGLTPKGFDAPKNLDELDPEERAQLNVRASAAYNSLNGALLELRRRLRVFVDGPKGTGNTCLETIGHQVRAGFRVAYLFEDDDCRHYRFGNRKS